MSKFLIQCPVCHNYAEAKTGFFASKRIPCACGNVINVKTDRMVSRTCPGCGNSVLFDQSKPDSTCPICHSTLVPQGAMNTLLNFRCRTCGCSLQANKAAVQVTCPVCDSVNDVQQQVKLAQEHASEIPSVISYEGDNRTFVWRHPNTDFVTGSLLIVHESQEAIFFRNGEALDSFGAGRHELQTGMLPKMNALYPLPVDGKPFHAEVYFVNLTTQMGIKWGTNSKVSMFDPISGIPVELGASGSFNLQVSDARRLVIRLVGTTEGLSREQLFSGDMGYFRTLVMTQVKAHLAKVIKGSRINVLEIDEHVDQISAALRDAINPTLAEYGLTMPEFYVSNIVTPDDDPNFRRLRQQHAEQYLRVREEKIRKAEAEAAFERKAVEAQTAARMQVIGAQGEADAKRIRAQAEAEAYRMQAEAEAMEMRMKGYTYQQETARQVGMEAMRNGGAAGGISGLAGDMMQLGVGLGTMGSVIGMAKDAISPVVRQAGDLGSAIPGSGWDCACGTKGITSKFCPNCGAKRPEPDPGWTCPQCGQTGITSNFCPNCGAKKPAPPQAWDCPDCGQKDITSNFCPNCGRKKA